MPATASRRKTKKPAAKGRKTPPKRATRSPFASRPSLGALVRAPKLEPHHIDIFALALIAIGIFLAGVMYFHWAGGTLGGGFTHATQFVFGALGYALPASLVAAGALVLMRELRPPVRPMRTGVICLVAAITLALAAGTLGLGPGPVPKAQYWTAAQFETRGGIIGQGEFWAISHLFSSVGAHILAAFLFIAGLILVSGATLASFIRVTGTHMLDTSRALRRAAPSKPVAATARGGATRPATAAARAAQDVDEAPEALEYEPEPLLPPEPDTAELIVRATHVEAPPIEGEDGGPADRRARRDASRPTRTDEPADADDAGEDPRRSRRPHAARSLPRLGD